MAGENLDELLELMEKDDGFGNASAKVKLEFSEPATGDEEDEGCDKSQLGMKWPKNDNQKESKNQRNWLDVSPVVDPRRLSSSSTIDRSFYSTVSNQSWISQNSLDETLLNDNESENHLNQVDVAATAKREADEDSVAEIQTKLRVLDDQRLALEAKLKNVKEKKISSPIRTNEISRTMVPLDFGIISQEKRSATSSKRDDTLRKMAFGNDYWSSSDDEEKIDVSIGNVNGNSTAEKRVTTIDKEKVLLRRSKSLIVKKKETIGGTTAENTANQSNDIQFFHQSFPVRVRKPKFSSQTFDVYCEGAQKVPMKDMRIGWKPPTDGSSWITVGVIVDKTGHKKSVSGNEYMIWKLSDLVDCQEAPVKLLLFGECLKKVWKLNVGSVVALVSCVWLESNDDARKGDCLSLKATKTAHVVEIGQSADFAYCNGKRKDAMRCHNFVNRSVGDQCVFHLQSAAKSMAARRGSLQNSGNIPPKSWDAKPLGDFSNVFYAGRMITKKTTKQMATLTLEQTRTNNKIGKALQEVKLTADGEESKKLRDILRNKAMCAGGRNMQQKQMTLPKSLESAKQEAKSKSLVKSFGQFFASNVFTPHLGRGFSGKTDVSLLQNLPSSIDLAKRKAAAAVIIGQRKAGNGGETEMKTTAKGSSHSRGSPLRKKTKFGDICFTSDQLQSILLKKSSHQSELSKEDNAKQDEYFKDMENREKVETRQVDLREIKNVKVISCKKCNYTWHSQSNYCKTQGHLISRHTANKRFYKCRQCGKRVISYDKLPNKPCAGCAGKDFDRVGMKDERKCPSIQEPLKITDPGQNVDDVVAD